MQFRTSISIYLIYFTRSVAGRGFSLSQCSIKASKGFPKWTGNIAPCGKSNMSLQNLALCSQVQRDLMVFSKFNFYLF